LQLAEFGLSCVDMYLKRYPTAPDVVELAERLEWHLEIAEGGEMTKPSWFGRDEIHREYQGLLRHLDPAHYEKVFTTVETCSPERFRYPLDV